MEAAFFFLWEIKSVERTTFGGKMFEAGKISVYCFEGQTGNSSFFV
jgi:hypothetical protein